MGAFQVNKYDFVLLIRIEEGIMQEHGGYWWSTL